MTRIITVSRWAARSPTDRPLDGKPPSSEFPQAYISSSAIPALSLVTLAMTVRDREASKVFLITYVTVFIVTINTLAGVASIPAAKLRAGPSGPASDNVRLRRCRPACRSSGCGSRWARPSTIVAAEMVAANRASATVFSSRLYMQTDAIFVAM
jgi:NitT/TauT family transport system permease protein